MTFLKTDNSGLTDYISERSMNEIEHYLNEDDREWFGSDDSLKVSLFDFKWIAKNNDPDGEVDYYDKNFSESWTVILNVGRSYPGGPGFKILVIDKDDIREFIFSDVFRERIATNIALYSTYESVEAYWNHEPMELLLATYIRYKDGLFYPNHAYDSPHDADELLSILKSAEESA